MTYWKITIFLLFYCALVSKHLNSTTFSLPSIYERNHFVGLYDASADAKEDDLWWRGRDQRNHVHPHMGARHPNGSLGMIVDPSPERLSALSNKYVDQSMLCPVKTGASEELVGSGGHKVLQKIRLGILKSSHFIGRTTNGTFEAKEKDKDSRMKGKKRSRILCMIYTFYSNEDKHAALRSQASTWGRQCDGFIGASNFTDHSVGAIDLPHLGPEEYGNMWQKLRSMWAYAYNYYRHEYDYFHVGGDDMYVAVENLRAYVDSPYVTKLLDGYLDRIPKMFLRRKRGKGKRLKGKRPKVHKPRPLILGTPMLWYDCPFPAGGPGYTINRAALELFGKVGLSSFSPNATDPREDVHIGSFFCNEGVYISDTQDDEGGWRYAEGADFSYHFDGKKSPISPLSLKRKFGFEPLKGINSVSEQLISFHLKTEKKRIYANNQTIPQLMYQYQAVLYNWCEKEQK